ncbi:type II toxin-antitoxin system RelE/ParE family toxin [Bradyrhizobium neotropicale]|uniref:type II toxin-antitoxin system RelE/ParE family toxin n=1 Tax=Bradyrhizobium neotropicale TaxID=1497615 RepID=UPI00289E061F|nr:type II toxin-antitoxin system RelE/ParE family toxin [Bradyrhizobium neotropicale]
MPTELVWSNQARTDLLDIYVMIGLEQPAAAERYLDRIEAKAELLRSQPRMGCVGRTIDAHAGRGPLSAALPRESGHR